MTVLLALALFLPLVVLATLRLTRLVTTDWLGEWVIVRPIKNWAAVHETKEIYARSDHGFPEGETVPEYDANDPFTWQAKLAKGLDCPFCVGYWVGALVSVVTVVLVLFAPGPVQLIWGVLLFTLALNYLVGHVSHRID